MSRFLFVLLSLPLPMLAAEPIHFSRQIRPILSENCFACHGPDAKKREAGLRFDEESSAKRTKDGVTVIVPGNPDASEMIKRIETKDPDDVMPPVKFHKTIEPEKVALLRAWIKQGAPWGKHWSYETVTRPALPKGADAKTGAIDAFIGDRLQREGLQFSAEADAATLMRRVALDVTGLPPTLEELNRLTAKPYGEALDYYLSKPAYGEHWARLWLDLARYADSSGYPSDQPREIWAYRDWVIRALNSNMPFDQFTTEQLAGDLLPTPTEDQLIATAFHRNTMTQNEGGTNDEEFRNAAIIDRVNTTMAVWMGTSMACAQCHTHKYDPITNKEYFQFYAILNQSADADKKDESPVHEFYSAESQRERSDLLAEKAGLEQKMAAPPESIFTALPAWEASIPSSVEWTDLKPVKAAGSNGVELSIRGENQIAAGKKAATSTYNIEFAVPPGEVQGVRLTTVGNAGNFVLSQVRADIVPADAKPAKARYLRLELVSKKYDFLALAEVEVFSGMDNIAIKGKASQISNLNGEPSAANLAIDGNTNGDSKKGKSVSITGGGESQQWWLLDLGSEQPVDRIVVWRRTDKGQGSAINDLKITLTDAQQKEVWTTEAKKTFSPKEEFLISGRRELVFCSAIADVTQSGFDAKDVLSLKPAKDKGWAVGGHLGKDHSLILVPKTAEKLAAPATLALRLVQASQWKEHTIGQLKVGTSADKRVASIAATPADVLAAVRLPKASRSLKDVKAIRDYFAQNISAELKPVRDRLAAVNKRMDAIKPNTVPVMKELAGKDRRVTHVQLRGNWQALDEEVHEGTPAAFPPLPEGIPANRLALAKWLVDKKNPLTARVMMNRLWEHVFGVGIVRTSEEFGSQGELPVHPELLDWLAAEYMDSGWDTKHMLTLMLGSRAYRQVSNNAKLHGSGELVSSIDPDNRLLSSGPRFRPTGELLRDQALVVAGLLNSKMYGPGVRPMSPNLGLSTAFGRSNDWVTSEGDEKHRRSLYTEVRRNSPYPAFSTFDAPNRETCTLRRGRTNTPLQAFVTLNDPVFIECAQAFARRIVKEGGNSTAERLQFAYRVCLARTARPNEAQRLAALLDDMLATYTKDKAMAVNMATDPLGPIPAGSNEVELAAWTAVANVIMNLDEFVMRR